MSTENDIERRVISERVENLLKALELKKEEVRPGAFLHGVPI